MLSAKENFLEAIRFGSPEYVPLGNEGVYFWFAFEDLYRMDNWTDGWGVEWKLSRPDMVPFPKGNPLTTLDRLSDYQFPDPAKPVLSEETRGALSAVDRGNRLVMGGLLLLLFERAWAVMGYENFLAALITHPQEAHRFLHGIAAYARGIFDRYLELGADGVTFSEDLGTQRALAMSPEMFREFLLPEYRYIFENVLKAGKVVHFHSCGCVHDVAGDLASIGVTVLDPVQARANDLARLKAATRGKMTLWGGIDTALLARGSREQVREEVVRVMETLKPGGGYVCAPDQAIPGIPEENMQALWETAREAGRY